MFKKLAAAAGLVCLFGASGVANAGYVQTFNNFGGSFLINNFEDGDGRFNIGLTNLDGTVSLEIPGPGTYGITLDAGSSFWIDYDGVPGPDIGAPPLPVPVSLGTDTMTVIGGLPGVKTMDFDFNGTGTSSFLVNGVMPFPPGTTRTVTLVGGGQSDFFAALVGIPGFLSGYMSGVMTVDITFMQDQLNFVIDASGLNGPIWRRPWISWTTSATMTARSTARSRSMVRSPSPSRLPWPWWAPAWPAWRCGAGRTPRRPDPVPAGINDGGASRRFFLASPLHVAVSARPIPD